MAGQIRQQEIQGTVATYRVVAVQQDLIEVEVVEAPGLAEGLRFRFAATAVEAMVLTTLPEAKATTRFARSLAA